MVLYRRNRIAGGTYFFTVTLRDRRSTLLIDRIDDLREAFRAVKRKRPFRLDAMAVLPDHLHAIWTLPEGDDDYSGRWRAIKTRFTRLTGAAGIGLTRNAKGEYDLWQRRFWEHTIRNVRDLQRHVDYIHFNPVKHGCVTRVQDWPHSTFHRYVRAGLYPVDWAGGDTATVDGAFGE
jgi:putative transposase